MSPEARLGHKVTTLFLFCVFEALSLITAAATSQDGCPGQSCAFVVHSLVGHLSGSQHHRPFYWCAFFFFFWAPILQNHPTIVALLKALCVKYQISLDVVWNEFVHVHVLRQIKSPEKWTARVKNVQLSALLFTSRTTCQRAAILGHCVYLHSSAFRFSQFLLWARKTKNASW